MSYEQLAEDFAVSSQISIDDLEEIAAAGFKSVICNRPDGEDFGQPSAEAIQNACRQHGLRFYHVPVTGQVDLPDAIPQQAEIMRKAKGPFFAYCRSGNRSTILWNIISRMT
jgi:uncharacterized protein (TIGR01244 family)